MPMPGMAVYAASKAFVLRFTEALAYGLRETPLTVLALVPGPTRTDFYRASGSSEKGVPRRGRHHRPVRPGKEDPASQRHLQSTQPVDQGGPVESALGRRVLGRTRDQTRANTTTGGWSPIGAASKS